MQYPDYNAEQRLRVGTDEAWQEYRARAGRDPNLAVHEKARDGRTLCGIAPDHVKFAGNVGKWAWVELGPGLVNCLSCKRAVSPQRLEEWREATIDEQRAGPPCTARSRMSILCRACLAGRVTGSQRPDALFRCSA